MRERDAENNKKVVIGYDGSAFRGRGFLKFTLSIDQGLSESQGSKQIKHHSVVHIHVLLFVRGIKRGMKDDNNHVITDGDLTDEFLEGNASEFVREKTDT